VKKFFLLIVCLAAACLLAACAGESSGVLAGTQVSDGNALTTVGEYMGMSDDNSYEIRIAENTYKVFILADKVRAAFGKLKLKMGDKVSVLYVKNGVGQLETQGIERLKEDKTVTGKYTGLADNNFFEVQTETGPMVFMLTDKVRDAFEKLKLQKGDRVTVNYTENKEGQLAVNSIKRAK